MVADFDGANGPDLGGLSGVNALIALRQAGGTFAAEQAYAMGSYAVESLRSADLDGDGRPDLVASGSNARSIVFRLNLGGGAFAPAVAIPAGGSARDLALGDLNGDGRPDAATALYDSAKIAVSLNDGSGALQTPFAMPVITGTAFVQIGDFTADGHADVLGVTAYCPTSPGCCTVTVFPGNGDGTFGTARTTTFPLAYRLSTEKGDVDGDGDLDLVLFVYGGVFWARNHGDGTFDAPVSTGLTGPTDTYGSARIAVGDLDLDGRPDIAVPAYLNGGWQQRNMFTVLINRGDGSFHPPAHHHVGRGPTDVALADLDGDGWLDGVVTTNNTFECCSGPMGSVQSAYELRNTGFGTFDAHLEVLDKVWMPARRSDGPADLVGTANGRLTRSRNRGHGTFLAMEDLGRGAPWRTADLDEDGDDEIFVTSSDSLWVLLAVSPGAYAPGAMRTGLVPRDVADFDGDGNLDLLVTDAALHLLVLPGDGAGALGAPIDYAFTLPEDPFTETVRGADVDADGKADLIYLPNRAQDSYDGGVHSYTAWLHVALNDGASHFGVADSFAIQYATTEPSSTPDALDLGDFDGDGILDAQLLVGSCGNDVNGWMGTFRGLGAGVFAAVGAGTSAGNSPCDLAVADMNGDGWADFVRSNGNGGYTMRATAFTATGACAFAQTSVGAMQELPGEVWLADTDGDDKLDVVTRSRRTDNASIRRNVTVYDVVTAAQLALVAAWLEDGAAWLDWHSPDGAMSAMLERRTESSGWSLLAPVRFDGTGSLRYVDRELPAASRVGYRLRWSDADGVHVTAETWLEIGTTAFALRGAWPNPATATPAFAIVLPQWGRADLEVFDLGGRRVAHERREGLAAGPQRLELASARLSPGVYVARVTFAGRRLESRFVVLE